MARIPDAVRVIAELAGSIVTVDEVSLIRDGPVRVKMNVRNLSSLRGFIEILIGKKGYELKFLAEDFKEKPGGLIGADKKTENDYSEEEDEEDFFKDNDSSWNKHNKSKKGDFPQNSNLQGGDDPNLSTKKLDKQWECPMDQTMIGSLPKVIHAPSGMADQISPQRTCTQQGGLELAKKSGLEDPTLSPIISGSQFLQMGGGASLRISVL